MMGANVMMAFPMPPAHAGEVSVMWTVSVFGEAGTHAPSSVAEEGRRGLIGLVGRLLMGEPPATSKTVRPRSGHAIAALVLIRVKASRVLRPQLTVKLPVPAQVVPVPQRRTALMVSRVMMVTTRRQMMYAQLVSVVV
jgi:hypothetical protein